MDVFWPNDHRFYRIKQGISENNFIPFNNYFCSYDLVKVFVGRRLIRRLTGGGGQEDNKYFKDDGDDDDDDDDDDDEDDECDDDDGDDWDSKGKFSEFIHGGKKREARVVSIHGTGEVVRIVFKSDPWVSRRGFFAHYSMGQGE